MYTFKLPIIDDHSNTSIQINQNPDSRSSQRHLLNQCSHDRTHTTLPPKPPAIKPRASGRTRLLAGKGRCGTSESRFRVTIQYWPRPAPTISSLTERRARRPEQTIAAQVPPPSGFPRRKQKSRSQSAFRCRARLSATRPPAASIHLCLRMRSGRKSAEPSGRGCANWPSRNSGQGRQGEREPVWSVPASARGHRKATLAR